MALPSGRSPYRLFIGTIDWRGAAVLPLGKTEVPEHSVKIDTVRIRLRSGRSTRV